MSPCLRVIFFLIVTVLLSAGAAVATPQIQDTLLYDGVEYPVNDDLMYEYFVKFPDRNPKDPQERCSGLWRGYRSVYEVEKGRIFLKDIFIGRRCSDGESVISKVVRNGERLAIDWYSGLLIAAYGQPNYDVSSYSIAFLYTFEKYSLFQITEGKLDIVKHFDNKGFLQFRQKQFEAYKKTDEYREEVKRKSQNAGQSRAEIDKDIEDWFLYTLKKLPVQ
ncbi:MAG: hypothetical protein ACJ73D_13745 [Pyrinomonadaceae bacterium]